MSNTMHEIVCCRVLTWATVNDGRIKTVADAVRYLKRKDPEGLRERVRTGMRSHAKRSTGPSLDFRPGIGSGRRAHWHIGTFHQIQLLGPVIHKDSQGQICGGVLRQLLRKIVLIENSAEYDKIDVPFPACMEQQPAEHYGWVKTENGAKWFAYRRRRLDLVIGADHLDRVLQADSPISGYLADSIMSWREGRKGYEGCCGCEYMQVAKQRPEVWDQLMARAPIGEVRYDDDGNITCEQTYPHEHERIQRLRDAGWKETFRMNDSLWFPTSELQFGIRGIGA